jgi:hypothetical protein
MSHCRDAKEFLPVCVLNPIKFALFSFKQKQGVHFSSVNWSTKGTITPQLPFVNKRTGLRAFDNALSA